MDKRENQIEKLSALVAEVDCGKYHDCSTCEEKDYMFCQHRHVAVGLYDKNVRVISDEEILLDKDEYERIAKEYRVEVKE